MFDFIHEIIFLSMLASGGLFDWNAKFPYSTEQVQVVRFVLKDMDSFGYITLITDPKPTTHTWEYHRIGQAIYNTYDAPQIWEIRMLLSDGRFLLDRKRFLGEYLYHLQVLNKHEHIRHQLSRYIAIYEMMYYAKNYNDVTYSRRYMNEYKSMVPPDWYYNGFPHDEVLRLFYETD